MKTFFALTALALGMAAPAQAEVYVLTVTGVTQTHSAYVYDMTDRLGLFGAPGGSMMGKAFTMTFRIDTGEPWLQTTSNATQSIWSSGINPYYQRGDAITGSFSMNGKTYRGIGLSGPNAAAGGPNGGVGSESQLSVQNGVSNQSNDLFSINTGFSNNYPGGVVQRWNRTFNGLNARINMSMDNAFGQSPRPDLYAGGGVLKEFDAVALPGGTFGNGSFSVGGNGTAGSNYYLGIQRVTLAMAAVPEPASWTLMIGGFGLVGGALRRRVSSARRPVLAG